MEAESAPLLNAWIGPMTTFMGGVLTAVAAGLYRSAHARIQDLSDRLSGIATQQAADVAALRRERAEGDELNIEVDLMARYAARLVEAPNLVDDVDTLDDLERLHDRLGRHTLGALEALRAGALG